ncbi:MAG: 4Fe-4S dicluster domain-containing protein [Kiritimatiellia bacterium]
MDRDRMTFDIVGVGCGIATLSTVLRLLKRVRNDGAASSRPPPSVLIIEKGASIGAHSMSGAVVDSESLADLLTLDEFTALPRFATVQKESFQYLTASKALRVPWVPPLMQAEGFPIVSLSAVTRYLAGLCEKAGAEIYCGFPAVELLRENGRVTGVRLGDKGVDKDGKKRSMFLPGADLMARTVILGEGACGFLSEQLIEQDQMRGPNPQTYAVGIKELLEIPERKGSAGTIMHTFGYPLDSKTYGGGFVYCLSDTLVAVGMVTALDYRNPTLNPHDLFRLFKRHPRVQPFLAGGKVVEYGAKVLPEGGVHSVPGLVADGAILVGDAGGLCNSLRLKGVHLAVQSGLAAGDTLFACWQNGDWSKAALQKYPAQLQKSRGWKELEKIRNVRASFHFGTIPGMMSVGMSLGSAGMLPPGRLPLKPDWESMRALSSVTPCQLPPKTEGPESNQQLDKLSDVFFSKTHHEENQPSHLKIPDPEKCKRCIPKYDAPCTRFCPAQVYVLNDDKQGVHIDFANCLHCKTCQIKDPLQNIQWTPPEGGGGPVYARM